MTTTIYVIDNDYYFLEVYVKENNTYWIDWAECDGTNKFIKKRTSNKNILCIKDNAYCFYNTKNSTFNSLEGKHLSLCVDNIKHLDDLHKLTNAYIHGSINIK